MSDGWPIQWGRHLQWGGHSCLPFGEAESDRAYVLRRAAMPVLLALLMAMVGCRADGDFTTGGGFETPIKPAEITYNELAERYNQAVEPLGTLWARTDVVIEWREAAAEGDSGGGELRREQGEGKFMYRRPDDTALLVEKLGQIYLWAGSDASRYWLFDLTDSDAKRAYVGAFDRLGGPGRRSYPLPVRPDAVPLLIGLLPLPVLEDAEAAPPIERYQGQYLVEVPGGGMRLLIDPERFRPTRIDLTDAQGYSILTAKLEGAFPVDVPGVRKTRWPTICERAEVYVAGYESRLTVAMDFVTNDPRKVTDTQFDFEAVKQGLRVEKVIPLDPE